MGNYRSADVPPNPVRVKMTPLTYADDAVRLSAFQTHILSNENRRTPSWTLSMMKCSSLRDARRVESASLQAIMQGRLRKEGHNSMTPMEALRRSAAPKGGGANGSLGTANPPASVPAAQLGPPQ